MLLNAWILWATLLIIISSIIAASKNPIKNKSVTSNYRSAAVAWWDRQPMYRIDNPEDIDGFLYFPQAAILHTPFSYGPPVLGEVLWRSILIIIFTAGLYQLAKLAHPDNKPAWFAVISFLAIFSVAGNLRNGQSNLLMAGTMMLAAASLANKSWWQATLWLVLGLALKPLGAVMLLLVLALYPKQMAWRLAIGILAAAAIPFLTAPWQYAWSQHVDFVTKMRAATAPNRMFADFKGMWDTYLPPAPDKFFLAVRALMAPVTLGLVYLAYRRFGDRTGALTLLAGATLYLMLFNPRTEGLSYAALAPILAVFFCYAIWQKRCLPVAIPLAIACVLFGLEYELITKHINASPGWFKPPVAVLFSLLLIYLLMTVQPSPSLLSPQSPDKPTADSP
jgi:alpha-1,2-mannosyltransferase